MRPGFRLAPVGKPFQSTLLVSTGFPEVKARRECGMDDGKVHAGAKKLCEPESTAAFGRTNVPSRDPRMAQCVGIAHGELTQGTRSETISPSLEMNSQHIRR